MPVRKGIPDKGAVAALERGVAVPPPTPAGVAAAVETRIIKVLREQAALVLLYYGQPQQPQRLLDHLQ